MMKFVYQRLLWFVAEEVFSEQVWSYFLTDTFPKT